MNRFFARQLMVFLILLCYQYPLDKPKIDSSETNTALLKAGRTWVFVIGVLRWQDPSIPVFTSRNRADVKFFELLKRRFHERSVALFDEQATLKKIYEKLNFILANIKPDEDLVFYFAGHGWYESNVGYLSNFDAGLPDYLAIDDLVRTLSKEFKGKSLIFFLDCCHSGAIAVKLGETRLNWAVFASADKDHATGDNWTFTRAVIDALAGNPSVDLDSNGVISFFEAERYIMSELEYFEKQKAQISYSGFFDRFAEIAHTSPNEIMLRGKIISSGKIDAVRIVALKGQQVRVRHVEIGRDDSLHDEWLDVSRLVEIDFH